MDLATDWSASPAKKTVTEPLTQHLIAMGLGLGLGLLIGLGWHGYRQRNRGTALGLASTLLEQLPDAAALYDSQGHIQACNQKMRALLMRQNIAPQAALGTLLAQLGISEKTQPPFTLPPGTQVTLQGYTGCVHLTPFTEPTHNTAHQLLYISDATELHALQTQRDKTLRFLGHDLRSPSASIISLLRSHALTHPQDPVHPKTSQIEQYAQAQLDMGQEFAVRMLAKVGPYKFKEEFLETLLNDAIEKIQASKHYKNQSLQEPLQSENIFIRVDSRLFLWALDQLLEKAIAETPENAVIDIQCETSLLQHSAAKQVCIHIAYTAAQAVPLQKPITTDLQLLDSIIEKHQGSMQAQQTDSRVDLRICLPCLVH